MASSEYNQELMTNRFRGYLPVVIDVETAGFNSQTDALLEMAAVTLEMDELGYIHTAQEYSAQIQPFTGANLEEAALEFTGIDPHDPERQAISEQQALTELFKIVKKSVKSQNCKRAILVGHNASFDQGFLNAAVARTEIKNSPFHPFSSFDTASLAGLAYGHTVLARACAIAGIEFDGKQAHSALYDTLKTAELFCSIVNHWKDLGGWDLIMASQTNQNHFSE